MDRRSLSPMYARPCSPQRLQKVASVRAWPGGEAKVNYETLYSAQLFARYNKHTFISSPMLLRMHCLATTDLSISKRTQKKFQRDRKKRNHWPYTNICPSGLHTLKKPHSLYYYCRISQSFNVMSLWDIWSHGSGVPRYVKASAPRSVQVCEKSAPRA